MTYNFKIEDNVLIVERKNEPPNYKHLEHLDNLIKNKQIDDETKIIFRSSQGDKEIQDYAKKRELSKTNYHL